MLNLLEIGFLNVWFKVANANAVCNDMEGISKIYYSYIV